MIQLRVKSVNVDINLAVQLLALEYFSSSDDSKSSLLLLVFPYRTTNSQSPVKTIQDRKKKIGARDAHQTNNQTPILKFQSSDNYGLTCVGDKEKTTK